MSFIYIASPYTSSDPVEVIQRYEAVLKFAAEQVNKGLVVYSPIVHCHPMAVQYELPKDFKFWEEFDKAMIDACTEVWVLTLHGWSASKGVAMEIQHARNIGKPVEFHNVD